MTVAVLAERPPGVPPRAPSDWSKMRVTWQGHDGLLWDLTNPRTGVFLIKGGVRGLGMPKVEHYRDRSPAVHGAFYRGTSYDSREVYWPVHLFHDSSSADWHDLDRRFWRSLHPEHEGVFTVTVPGVSTRSLRLRLEGDGNWTPDLDPGFFGWATYGVTLQADQPLWEAEAVPRFWEAKDLPDFHGGLTPGAPIINIGQAADLANARIDNPGDVEAWGEWTVHGPVPSGGAAFTIDGRSFTLPVPLAAGEFIRVDTRPTEQTVVNQLGQDVFASVVGEWDPAPIPAGSASQVNLSLSGGTGRIDLRFVPLHLRAW